MADYGCWPVWHHGSGEIGNIDPRKLGLSVDLQVGLRRWAEVYESHLNWSDPAATHWTESEEAEFDREGRRLSIALARELNSQYSVFYFDQRSAKCVPVEDLFVHHENA